MGKLVAKPMIEVFEMVRTLLFLLLKQIFHQLPKIKINYDR